MAGSAQDIAGYVEGYKNLHKRCRDVPNLYLYQLNMFDVLPPHQISEKFVGSHTHHVQSWHVARFLDTYLPDDIRLKAPGLTAQMVNILRDGRMAYARQINYRDVADDMQDLETGSKPTIGRATWESHCIYGHGTTTLTRAERLGKFARTPDIVVPPEAPYTLTEMHAFTEEHELGHTLSNHLWVTAYLATGGHPKDVEFSSLTYKKLWAKLGPLTPEDDDIQFMQYLDECINDTYAALKHVQNGGHRGLLDDMAAARTAGLNHPTKGNAKYATAPCIQSVAENTGLYLPTLQNMGSLEIYESAVSIALEHTMSRVQFDTFTPDPVKAETALNKLRNPARFGLEQAFDPIDHEYTEYQAVLNYNTRRFPAYDTVEGRETLLVLMEQNLVQFDCAPDTRRAALENLYHIQASVQPRELEDAASLER